MSKEIFDNQGNKIGEIRDKKPSMSDHGPGCFGFLLAFAMIIDWIFPESTQDGIWGVVGIGFEILLCSLLPFMILQGRFFKRQDELFYDNPELWPPATENDRKTFHKAINKWQIKLK